MTKAELERAERRARARMLAAFDREARLVDEMSRAIATLDDFGLSQFDRFSKAAAILEKAIGREPRRSDV